MEAPGHRDPAMQKLSNRFHNPLETQRPIQMPGLWRATQQTAQEVKNLFFEYLDPVRNGTRGERNTWIFYHLVFIIGAAGFFAAWRLTP